MGHKTDVGCLGQGGGEVGQQRKKEKEKGKEEGGWVMLGLS